MPRKTMHQPPLPIPPDNLPVRTHILEHELPQLSLADLEAVGHALSARWQELKQVQRREAMEAHYAHLRALPAGTPLSVAMSTEPRLATGDIVTLERPLRQPSTNIMVHDVHGTLWRFPMDWLFSEVEGEAMRTVLLHEASARRRESIDRALADLGVSRKGGLQ
jgi:hypothetical protein